MHAIITPDVHAQLLEKSPKVRAAGTTLPGSGSDEVGEEVAMTASFCSTSCAGGASHRGVDDAQAQLLKETAVVSKLAALTTSVDNNEECVGAVTVVTVATADQASGTSDGGTHSSHGKAAECEIFGYEQTGGVTLMETDECERACAQDEVVESVLLDQEDELRRRPPVQFAPPEPRRVKVPRIAQHSARASHLCERQTNREMKRTFCSEESSGQERRRRQNCDGRTYHGRGLVAPVARRDRPLQITGMGDSVGPTELPPPQSIESTPAPRSVHCRGS